MFPGSLSAIHEHHGSFSRPRRASRQNRRAGLESSIDPTDSLELVSSKRTSNSAHLDEFSDMLMKRQAHPIETEAVKSLLSMGSSASVSSDTSSAKQNRRKKGHPRVSEDSFLVQKSSRGGDDGLSSFYVESGSGIDPSESRSGGQELSGAGGGEHASSTGSMQRHLGNTMRLRDMQPAAISNAPNVCSIACTAIHNDLMHLRTSLEYLWLVRSLQHPAIVQVAVVAAYACLG